MVNEGCLMGDVVTAEGLGLAVKYGDIQALADALLANRPPGIHDSPLSLMLVI